MAELSPLLEALQSSPPSSSPPPPTLPSSSLPPCSSCPSTFSDPSFQHACRFLASLLADLPRHIQHLQSQDERERTQEDERVRSRDTAEASGSDGGVLLERDFRCWTLRQIEAVLDITEAAILHYLYIPLECGVTESIEGVFRNTVELCLISLVNMKNLMTNLKQNLSPAIEQVYNKLLSITELALDSKNMIDRPHISSDLYKEIFQGLSVKETIDASFQKTFEIHEVPDPETVEVSGDIILLLTNDQPLEFVGEPKYSSRQLNMLSATQYYVISRTGFHKELIHICFCLLHFESEHVEKQIEIRLLMVSRILRLLALLSKGAVRTSTFLVDVQKALGELIIHVRHVLRHESITDYESLHNESNCYVTFVSSVIALANAVCPGSCVIGKLKVYVAATALEILVMDESDKVSTKNAPVPVVLEPQFVLYVFSLIRDVVKSSMQHATEVFTGNAFERLSLQLWSKDFNLTSIMSQSEMIQTIFPENLLWLQKLLESLTLLHSIDMDARLLVDRSLITKQESKNEIPAEIAVGTCEDEALFGNLFAESNRQSFNNESHAQLNVVGNKQSVYRDMILQAIIDVLIFLKGHVFSLDSETPFQKLGQSQMNNKCIDLLWEMLVHSSVKSKDSIGTDRVFELRKVSFDILNLIARNKALPCNLHQHLLLRILENAYAGYTIPENTLILLANILINYSSRSRQDDSLTVAVWNSFLDRVADRLQMNEWTDASLWKASQNLPSIFFVEVLLMAFHSSTRSTRMSTAKKIRLTLKYLCREVQVENICLCSLLFSVLIMLLRYMPIHFETFPRWLLVDLKLNLSHVREDGSRVDAFPMTSITSILCQSLKDIGPTTKQCVFNEGISDSLFDINPFSIRNLSIGDVFQSLPEFTELCNDISGFMEKWAAKTINRVEELLVERHAFILGWLIVRDISKHANWSPSDLCNHDVESFEADFSLKFTRNIYSFFNQDSERKYEKYVSDWWIFLMAVLTSFETKSNATKFVLVNGLRQLTVLNVLLSFLGEGLKVLLAKQDALSLPECEDDRVQIFCAQLVHNCVYTGSLDLLLKALLSVLCFCVNCFHCSVVDILSDSQVCKVSAFSIRLVLEGGLSWTRQDQIFTRLGVSFSPLHVLLRRGMPISWLTEMLSKCTVLGKMDNLDTFFLPSLLQGFPCNHHPSSAMVVSCMSSIRQILKTLKLLLKISLSGCTDNILDQNVFLKDLVDVLMMMKLEENFESVHGICEEVLLAVLPSDEQRSSIHDLYLLKQKESLLKALAGNHEISNAVKEDLILDVIEVFSNIYSDSARNHIFMQHFVYGSGNLSYLMDVLNGCSQENVNMKVLQLLTKVVEIENTTQGSLRCTFREKLMSMDIPILCAWLDQRLLGCTNKSADGATSFSSSSNTVRDLAVEFLCALATFESTVDGQDLQSHLLNALLLSSEQAFNSLDNGGLQSYLKLLHQLANKEQQFRHVLQSMILLMSKSPGPDGQVESLKALIMFFNSNFHHSSNEQPIFLVNTTEKKHLHGDTNNPNKSKILVQKTAEVGSIGQNGQSVTAECDTFSVDEDEDDITSDGEITSFDKEEDDDGGNSEKDLASKVCTFTSSGNNFMEQHWYFCYTCDLTVSKGCCSVCAKVCHKGHKVVYSRHSRFFCDCGAGSVRGQSCACLKPRKFVCSSSFVSSTDQDAPSESDSDLEDDEWADNDKTCNVSGGEDAKFLSIFIEMDVEGHILSLCERLLQNLNLKKHTVPSILADIDLGREKVLSCKSDFMHLGRLYKSGSFDMKIKADYVNAKELKSQLVSGTLFKSVLSINSRGKLAVGEGDKVTLFDVEQVIGQSSTAPITVDKTAIKVLSKSHVRFEIVHLVFNAAIENYLAVAGYEDCQIFTVNSRGEVIDRLAIELALQGAHIRRIMWVAGSQVQLMVATNKFVKIYDLSQDNISPLHYFTIHNDDIVDASLVSLGQGHLLLVVLSQQGVTYTYKVTTSMNLGMRVLTDVLKLPEGLKPGRGLSLHYSSVLQLLFISYADGLSLIAQTNEDGSSISDVSSIIEVDQDMKQYAAGLHNWKELINIEQGLFISLSSHKSNSPVAISIGSSGLQGQYVRVAGNLSSRIDGVVAHRSLLKDKYYALILHDDGSLHVYTYGPGSDASSAEASKTRLEAEQIKKLGDAILRNRGNGSSAPVFPIDFFERTNCITNEIRLSGDVLRSLDSEAAKLCLASEDGFLEGPNLSGFKITVHNPNADVVMVGCRVHVGNSSTSHIPSELRIFQRSVKLEESVRCWYDLPFTNAESLLADEEFTLFVGQTFGGFSAPRIDNLEVYGRTKDDFGWKEKLEAILDKEIHSAVTEKIGCENKYKFSKSVSAEEKILADCFMLLCGYYLTTRWSSTVVNLEFSRERCKPLFEAMFETDRHPLLQAAVKSCIHALYTEKDTFYQVMDTMKLTGISRVCSSLIPRVSLSGSSLPCLIKDFIVKLRTVCKIALHRRANFASFLQSYGSSVIDDLMRLLWELLTVEQQDSETVNHLIVPAVDLIYCYAECLAIHGCDGLGTLRSVAPAVALFKGLLFSPKEAVRSSCSLAMSSRLLQVPFPRQTILANDEVGDNSKSVSLPSGSSPAIGGPDGQNMTEEDGGNASVQYCCDVCAIVPIMGRRWHCNICPDFDLCETCYEVMDGDKLPPPHSRGHPMSAIPIDNSGNDAHFTSMDEISEENLLQMAAEFNIRSPSASLSSALDVTRRKDESFCVIAATKNVAISASKRALNSVLLKSLVEECKGWTKSTTGTESLPLMQFFYRLASTTGSPFMETSGTETISLDKFVESLMEELNVVNPLLVRPRSNFGEVVVLIFTFFNLMLRNWHQPGSDHSSSKSCIKNEASQNATSSGAGSPSSEEGQVKGEAVSQLEKACATLRQQQLLNYILSILQQLTEVFKSSRNQESCPAGSGGPICGALLTIKKEFVAGNFAPYFTDSYAKAHRNDLFGEFYRLLLESAFRLAYNLVRPEKASEKDQVTTKLSQDLKLNGWQEVLCSYINNPHTTSIRRFARRLLLHLCESKGQYYNIRDGWQLSREVKKLHKLIQKEGGFQARLVYEKSVKLVKCLSAIVDVATARPKNWQKYCLRHPDILQFLLTGVFLFGEESVVQTLKLLTLAFYTGKEACMAPTKGETDEMVADVKAGINAKQGTQTTDIQKKKKSSSDDTVDSIADKTFLDMGLAVDQLAAGEGTIFLQFINVFLLDWNAACVRAEAKSVLVGAWHHGKPLTKETLLKKLLEKVPVLPSYGQNISEYTSLLTWILGKGVAISGSTSEESDIVLSCVNSEVVKNIYDALRSQNELLANHPNSRIYNTLSSLVDFDGYYLESEPCLACSCPEVPYSRMKLDNLKSETKFTDNRILVKCVGSHTIQSVTMNVHDARRSKSVKVLNLYYNNKPVTDLSELKNNWSLWKKAKSCHLAVNQTELKVEFPIPITACNFMIELDAFYENLQASSLESLQCPRCSRYVTDKHGICANCHENAYQCRQCRNINYENLDSFLCNECGYSKYGRFEFNFTAKPSFHFESMENDEDMKKGLAAIEAESESAHKRYQQLLNFKKPLLKLVSSIGESEMDSQQKDSVQQMIVSLPGSSSFKINRKIAILGVLYGEKCKMAFDSLSRSVQNLQGLRRVLTSYLEQKKSHSTVITSSKLLHTRPINRCYGCANTFVGQCLEWLQMLAKMQFCRQQLISAGILSELFENNIHQGSKVARVQARSVLCAFTEGDGAAVAELNVLIKQKTMYCLEHHRSVDVASCVREELQLLSETCALIDEFWESRLRVVFQLLFSSIKVGAKHPVIAEHIILPCLKIVAQACTLPKAEDVASESENTQVGSKSRSATEEGVDIPTTVSKIYTNLVVKSKHSGDKGSADENQGQDVPLVSYEEWKSGVTYVDFVRRQYMASQVAKPSTHKTRKDQKHTDFLALKYLLRWKRMACRPSLRTELAAFEESSWVSELALSACSPAIRIEMCGLIEVLSSQSAARKSKFLNLLMALLPATQKAGESASDYFDLLFKMVESEDARLFLTVRGFLQTLCRLITEEVSDIESQEHAIHVDISQGYILHKLLELLGKFLQIPNIRGRFMKDGLISQILEALLVVRGLVVQKTKLISDCGHLLTELLKSLLEENFENKRHFIRACIAGLQGHMETKRGRTLVYILELLCNVICPTKPEPAYMIVLNKAHTQEEFIRGSMTKNPYSSLEVGPLMRDVKNKICHQLDLLGLLEDDYGMELLVAGNIISLDLSVSQVYEQVWRKAQSQLVLSTGTSVSGISSLRECPPMTVTYRLQGLDGEATEPMIKELDDDREESQDPEIEFAIAGVMRDCNGLNIVINMIQAFNNDYIKSGQEEFALLLKLLMYCCKVRDNRLALLQLGALGVLIETARRAFAVEATETAEGLLLIVECLVMEANESNIGIVISSLNISEVPEGAGGQAAYVVRLFLERLSSSSGAKKSTKQQRNDDMVARILPYLTYGEQEAMEVLVEHFDPYLHNWNALDQLLEHGADEMLSCKAAEHRIALENFCKVAESIKHDAQGERLKGLIMNKGITTECINHLKLVFSVFENGGDYKSTSEWTHALEKPSIPIILMILRGLSSGHAATQKSLSQGGILPLLHALESVSGDNEIGAKAENLLDTVANKDGKGEGFLKEDVLKLRHATRDEMRKKALQRREELLQGLGMRREVTSGGERIVISAPSIEGLEDVQEEEAGLACMVCREGYSLCPANMLGAYSYSKRLNLGIGMGGGAQSEWVYTTVSHFNVIHFQCHLEAKRADASLKNPKKEWEGAAIRNNETLCNNLFPLRAPSVPLVQYARHVDQYWDNLNALGRADGSRLRLLTYDIVLMLARFATGASFSTDSKGGGKESNSRLLPFMLQMACHLLDQGGISQKQAQAKALGTYVNPSSAESPSKLSTGSSPKRFGAVDETAQFMMVQSLLLDSLDDWQKHRQTLLQKSICHAYMQHKSGHMSLTSLPSTASSAALSPIETISDARSPENASTSIKREQLFTVARPMLAYCGLIDQLQRFLKSHLKSESGQCSSTIVSSESMTAHGALEPWEIRMRERLQDIKCMLGFSKELLEWLDDMQSAEGLQEAFDVMGDPLSSSLACEEFIMETISY